MRATRHHRVFESGQTHSAHRSCTDARSIPFLAIDDDLGSCATVALSHSERLARAARSAELMVLRRGGPQPLSGGGRSADNGATGTASWGQRRWRIPFGSSGASLHFRAPVFCSPPSLRVATAETICGSSGSATAIAPLLPDGLSGFGWRTPRVGPLGGRSGPPHGGGDPPAGIEMSFNPNRFGPRASQDGSAWRIRRKNLENTYASRSKTSAYTHPPSRD
jgi:hypothetical protein